MKPEVAERWAAALESDEYRDRQVRGALTRKLANGEQGYCAVGVLCQLAVEDGALSFQKGLYDTKGAKISMEEWAGISNPCACGCDAVFMVGVDVTWNEEETTVIGLNDGYELSFPEIAQIIRKNFL